MTSDEFGKKFGAPVADYEAVVAWAQANGFTVTTHPNRFTMVVAGTVASVEAALNVELNYALRPDGTRFYEPDREPSVTVSVPIANIDNLNDYEVRAPQSSSNGTGFSGNLKAGDLRSAYISCVPAGTNGNGQTIGVCNPNPSSQCFLATDIANYVSTNNLGSYATVHPIQAIGMPNNGACPDGGLPGTEATIDPEMIMAIAPGAQIVIVAGSADAILSTMAQNGYSTNSCSYGLGSLDSTGEGLMNELAIQGQSFIGTSGDKGAYSPTNDGTKNLSYIAEQAMTIAGGTVLVMSDAGPGGSKIYGSETGWPGSGGGPLSNPDGGPSLALQIPPYQVPFVGVGVPDSGASTSIRNVPDISMPAANLDIQLKGDATGAGGTSCAAPLFAALISLTNQQASSQGLASVGFANPALYWIADLYLSNGTYFNDITSGSNLTQCGDGGPCIHNVYYATKSYDLVTGLGSPACGLVNYLASLQADPWQTETNSSLSCATEVAGANIGPATAWAISCTTYGDGYSIYRLPTLGGSWVQAPGAAIHVAVSPSGVPWVVNNVGAAYQLENSGVPCTTWSSSCSWVEMNSYGASGPHNSLRSIAPGNGGTAWAVSNTTVGSGGDYTIYYYNGGASGEGTWEQIAGGLQQVAISSANIPYGVNHAGAMFAYLNGAWTVLSVPVTDKELGSGYTGQALSIAASPAEQSFPWIIASTGSGSTALLELVQSNTTADNVWSPLPYVSGGAARFSVDPGGGFPWVVTQSGTILFAYWAYPQ